MPASVVAVHSSPEHTFTKPTRDVITLLEGLGVEGDAHRGVTVKHRSRVAANPSTPNLRQVHLLHRELFDDLARVGHQVGPGELGENITTRDIDLLALPVGTRLTFGDAVVVVTGLRNPCRQINTFQEGLLRHVVHQDEVGRTRRLTGVMGVVARGGEVRPDDVIGVELPDEPHLPLTVV